jgi:hypothetical protein
MWELLNCGFQTCNMHSLQKCEIGLGILYKTSPANPSVSRHSVKAGQGYLYEWFTEMKLISKQRIVIKHKYWLKAKWVSSISWFVYECLSTMEQIHREKFGIGFGIVDLPYLWFVLKLCCHVDIFKAQKSFVR